jgi:hypothetical protein
MRKPPFTAWALNVVAREEPSLVAAAIDAGDALQRAMQEAAAGDRAALSDAQHGERAATDALIAAAATRIEGQGHQVTDAFRQRMQGTVRAAQLDGEVADRLHGGRLAVDEEASIFGLAAPAAPTTGRATKRSTAKAAKQTKTKTKPAPSETPPPDRAAQEARREAVARHQRLRKEAERLDGRAARLEEKAEHLRAQADAATAEAQDARADADAARAEADAADPG